MSIRPEKSISFSFLQVGKQLYPVLRKHLVRFYVGIFLILCSTAIDLTNPILIGRIVDSVSESHPIQSHVQTFCYLFLGLIIFQFLLDALKAYLIESTGQRVTQELRTQLFERISHLPVEYFDKNPVGRPLTRVVNDIKTVGELFGASISVIILDILIIIGTIGAMLWVHWQLALAILVTFPCVLLCIHFFSLRLAKGYREVRTHLSEINAFLGENIAAIATIQRLAAEKERYQKFSKIVKSHFRAQISSMRIYAKMGPINNTLNGIATATLLILGGYWVMEEKISIGILVTFLGYIRNLFQPIRDLVEKYNRVLAAKVSAERVLEILDEKLEMPMSIQNNKVSNMQLGIDFKNVSFRYPSRNSYALKNVQFSVKPGECVAIVGATGSGKSSLIRLLLRFYEISSGKLLVGNKPIENWDKSQLRRHIGVVHQDLYLMGGTLRENLSIGRTDLSDAFLVSKCRQTHLWNFIERRGGLEMPINEGGSNLSTGEKQLISFTRVLINNPPLLILDEATSSIDRNLETRLMDAFRDIVVGRTSLVIAHRLSTIRFCDRILVLDHGELREQGSYESLTRNRGLFYRFLKIHSHASAS